MEENKADEEFGAWITERRMYLGITRKEAAKRAAMQTHRLASIERGSARIGIRKNECENLAAAYRISLKEIISKATLIGIDDLDGVDEIIPPQLEFSL